MLDRRCGRLHFFFLDPSGNRSIIEICTEAHGTDCPAGHDHYAPSFGDRDADDLCAADSAVVSAVYNHASHGWNSENRQTALTHCAKREPERSLPRALPGAEAGV